MMRSTAAEAPERHERRRIRPELFFVGSAIFHYLGPSFAVLLFARIEPLGVAWLRILVAATVFAIWRRPWRRWRSARRDERATILAWGVLLAGMNSVFYLAIDRLPLGTVAAIEFVGPIAIAAFAVRTLRNAVAIGLTLAGLALLSDVSLAGSPLGFLFALANMVLFAGYVIIGHRVSRHTGLTGVDGLALAMIVAGVASAPIGMVAGLPALTDPVALGAAIGVGVTSSVIPYVFDQLAMRRLARETYALMTALLPATATVIGLLILAQRPQLAELLGIGLVVIAIVVHRPVSAEKTYEEREKVSDG
ncbi:EamA family transporter [Georgenia deserti]|uniref:DMT family transporter n=1 Tax=Georgenia deserti TaxID=2093781 RepID=A0ABW4L5Z1_9MICO